MGAFARTHDWLVVTEPRPELDEPLPLDVEEPVSPLEVDDVELPELAVPELVSVDVVPEPLEALLDTLRLASAGSCPLIRVTAISIHMATNSATAPPTTRRRMVRTRASRAVRIKAPRAAGSGTSVRVIGILGVGAGWSGAKQDCRPT